MTLPLLFRVGDDWSVLVTLTDASGDPVDLTGATVSAILYSAIVQPIGTVVPVVPASGSFTVLVPQSVTSATPAQVATATTYPTRLSVSVVDALGHRHTYDPVPILPLHPQDDTPVPVAGQSVVLTACAQGPAGPPGSGSGAGGTVLTIPITAASTKTATHAFSYQPRTWLVDSTGAEVETDVLYGTSQVTVVFALPFTGTLYLA